jgi:hypothetical protein
LLAAGLELEELQEAMARWRDAQDDANHSLDWLRPTTPRTLRPGEGRIQRYAPVARA